MNQIDFSRVEIRVPAAQDALHWDHFVVAEQSRAYAGLVPDDFRRRQLADRDAAKRRAEFSQPGSTDRLLAELDGEIVGVAEACDAPAAWERWLGFAEDAPASRELSRLYLSERARGSGLAADLMQRVLGADAAYLWIIDGNDRAQRFYSKHGFVDYGQSVPAGQTWGGIPMHRMVRPASSHAQAN